METRGIAPPFTLNKDCLCDNKVPLLDDGYEHDMTNTENPSQTASACGFLFHFFFHHLLGQRGGKKGGKREKRERRKKKKSRGLLLEFFLSFSPLPLFFFSRKGWKGVLHASSSKCEQKT
jgi:hypothetical protein